MDYASQSECNWLDHNQEEETMAEIGVAGKGRLYNIIYINFICLALMLV